MSVCFYLYCYRWIPEVRRVNAHATIYVVALRTDEWEDAGSSWPSKESENDGLMPPEPKYHTGAHGERLYQGTYFGRVPAVIRRYVTTREAHGFVTMPSVVTALRLPLQKMSERYGRTARHVRCLCAIYPCVLVRIYIHRLSLVKIGRAMMVGVQCVPNR